MKAWIEPTLSVHHIRTVSDLKHEIPDYRAQTIEDVRSLVRPVHPDHQQAVIDLFHRYSQIMGPDLSHTSVALHRIVTEEALPIALSYYRCLEAWKTAFKEELKYLKDNNFVEISSSPWLAPMFAVPKKDGSIRLVVDYHRLNQVTVPDPYTMPRIEILIEKMGSAKIFFTLDLKKGYYQVSVYPQHREKTAFVTEYGKYQFKVMPFVLKNAPATFQ